MSQPLQATSDVELRYQRSPASLNLCEAPSERLLPFQVSDVFASKLVKQSSSYIHLDLEDLRCFEIVERQYQQYGLTFKNAIALRPSNPAFPPRSGSMVLTGAPKSGVLEAVFDRSARYISGYVTGSRRTVLSAFDCDGQLIQSTQTPGPNLQTEQSVASPNYHLELNAENIYSISFRSFGGQFTLDDFSFGF